MAQKPKVQYRVIKQSAEVGGKFYGVINNANPTVPTLTMQQVIDYKKLHNFSASQLAALIEDVLQGCAELVARDGQPRNLSELLKFEARIRGSFSNAEAGISDQKIYVAPRMLKDIKVELDKSEFEFNNLNDNTAPKFSQAALEYDGFDGWKLSAFTDHQSNAYAFKGPLVLSGLRLCPNGWTADCKFTAEVLRNGLHFCYIHAGDASFPGMLSSATPTVASVNAIKFANIASYQGSLENGWEWDDPETQTRVAVAWVPALGDQIRFTFERELTDGSGSVVSTVKTVTLGV